ncbi:polyprenyl synthetase family protein [Spirochaeta lutea]|uniref:polyprenyl synthetase family protein n=1 Tax=Spirochaeta lutea TaxID=1480694 RepID=UPI0006920F6A|nr:polyprenyl synthetase family protein [Spirochaeta lutea]
MIFNYVTDKKKLTSAFLGTWFSEKADLLKDLFPEFIGSFDRILRFTTSGKMLRGGLVFLLEDLYRHAPHIASSSEQETVKVAAAMELIQSFLLIHDDIMDRDQVRRGEPSMYMQYASDISQLTPHITSGETQRIGEALGICAGDVTNFFAFEILSELAIEHDKKQRIFSHTTRELSRVGFAQMQDVRWSVLPTFPSPAQIITMYINKTGRYTFSLPMIVGAILGNCPDNDIEVISEIGDILGILFQMRDDELGLYGEPTITGKSSGSDIREGKKTVFMGELVSELLETQESLDLPGFGKHDASDSEVAHILKLMETYNVRGRVNSQVAGLKSRADRLIGNLHTANDEKKTLLIDLLNYVHTREK